MRRVLLAGGGTAGHTSPLLATADALRRRHPDLEVTALGTSRGLETTVVPAAGYPLELVPPVPLSRRLNADLLKTPVRLKQARDAALEVLDRVRPDVVVGFGGYVSVPAYLAARKRRLPLVVHEGNAVPGVANKLGARFTTHVATSFPGTPLPHAQYVGLPIRQLIATLDRQAARAEAREFFELDPEAPVLLVTGGSQGARRLNESIAAAAADLAAAGVQVLHVVGPKQQLDREPGSDLPPGSPPYRVLSYVERMDLAYAAADLVVCRAGSNTVTEVSGVGLPAVFVPLPIGNGEQARNAADVVAAGGALLIDDDAFTPEALRNHLLPLLADRDTLADMGARAAGTGPADGAARLARLVAGVARGTGSDGADDAAGPDDAPGETR